MKLPHAIIYGKLSPASLVMCLICLVVSNGQLQGQQRFYLKAKAGLNISQIDGDHANGFDYVGIQAGLVGAAILSDRFELLAEFLYNQKGSKFERDVMRVNQLESFSIKLDYIEVPVMFNYILAYNRFEKRSWEVRTGFSFGAIVRKNITETVDPGKPLLFEPLQSELKTTSFNWVLGFALSLSDKFGAYASFTYALSPAYENPDPAPESQPNSELFVEFLKPYFISLGLSASIF